MSGAAATIALHVMKDPDSKLITALQQGDQTAADKLVEIYGNRLLRSAYLLCGNETDAHDLVQETFIQAVKSARQFRHRSKVFTWLYGILLNCSRHYIRGRKRWKKLFTQRLLLDKIPEKPETTESDEKWASAVLTYGIHQLSTPHREVIVLRFFENMKIEDVAEQLGTTPGTVKSRLHYALKQLRKKIPYNLNVLDL